jgi:hypothetical protein
VWRQSCRAPAGVHLAGTVGIRNYPAGFATAYNPIVDEKVRLACFYWLHKTSTPRCRISGGLDCTMAYKMLGLQALLEVFFDMDMRYTEPPSIFTPDRGFAIMNLF